MISERKFSNSFSSFWNELLPTADSFVKRINLSLRRYCLPTNSKLETNRDRRAVINELAFRFFMCLAKRKDLSMEDKVKLSIKVSKYIENFSPNIHIDLPISEEELSEAESLVTSLSLYFLSSNINELIFWPTFKGCGKIHSCKGDIMDSGKLIEVKAGDRNFRIIDIRQVITYLSLNFLSNQYAIENVVLLNPRKGLSFETTVDFLIEGCSRRKPVDVFADIIDFLSSELLSK